MLDRIPSAAELDAGEATGAWHDIHVVGDENRCEVYEQTNDNLDLGHPNLYADWTITYTRRGPDSALAQALRHVGVSRTGMSGVRVTVTVNGAEI